QMGSLLSSSRNQQSGLENQNPYINQEYDVEFGNAPIGPLGPIRSVPKNNMYNRRRPPPPTIRHRRIGC
ncbi:unnamed protein product, partial [Adineta steineri]